MLNKSNIQTKTITGYNCKRLKNKIKYVCGPPKYLIFYF